MVEFIEKECWTDQDQFIGRTYAPVYMVKDGVEYFVVNRVVKSRDGSWARYDEKKSHNETEQYKEFLRQHEYRYFKFNGFYDDPFEMLEEIRARKHTFTHPEDLFLAGSRFIDFHGNRNEVSAAFHYRIYDTNMVEEIRRQINPIIVDGK